MNITLRQLQVFRSVADKLSYTKAAAELHLTQPAVSMQVKQLEEQLGLPLFDQIGKKIHLTEAGRQMLRHSRTIAGQLEEIGELFARLKGIEGGTLRLAASGTAIQFVTLLLAEFCRRHPSIRFRLDTANRESLLQRLADNAADLVIMEQPPADRGLLSEGFMPNPLVVIAPPDHPLAKRKKIPLATLMENEFMVREPGSGTRIAMERFCTEQQVELRTSMELSSNTSIKHAVAAGLGLGIVSLHTLELELALKRLAVLPAERFPIMRQWYLVSLQDKHLPPVAAAFKTFVADQALALWPLATGPPAAGPPAAGPR